MPRSIQQIEDELNELQMVYINEDDEFLQLELERAFTHRLEEATQKDGILRVAVGVTINNWTRSSQE